MDRLKNAASGGIPAAPRRVDRPDAGFFPSPVVLAILVVLGLLAWQLADVVVLVFGAAVFAVALRAMATLLERYARVGPRFSILLTVLSVTALLAAIGWMVGDALFEQLSRLRERLPAAIDAVMTWIGSQRFGPMLLQGWEDAKDGGVPWSQVAGFAGITLGALGTAGLMVVMGIYLAAAPDVYRKGLVSLLPLSHRDDADAALQESADALRRWLVGQAISMVFVGSATALGLWWLDIPLPVAVGLVSGLLAFVPFFGALAGGALAVLLAFIEGPQSALYVLILCVAIQQVEGQVLMPLVQNWAVDLPPVLGIGAAVVFGILFGLIGVLFATPLMIVLMVMVRSLYVEAYLEAPAEAVGTR